MIFFYILVFFSPGEKHYLVSSSKYFNGMQKFEIFSFKKCGTQNFKIRNQILLEMLDPNPDSYVMNT